MLNEIKVLKNNTKSSNQLSFTLTASSQAAALTNPFLIPGVGVAANKELPANVTFTSNAFASYADFVDYMTNVPLGIKGIRFQSNDPGNFAGSIRRIIRRPNNSSNPDSTIELGELRDIAISSELADVINITGEKLFEGGILTTAAMSLQYQGLKQSSYLKVTLDCSSMEVQSIQEDL